MDEIISLVRKPSAYIEGFDLGDDAKKDSAHKPDDGRSARLQGR